MFSAIVNSGRMPSRSRSLVSSAMPAASELARVARWNRLAVDAHAGRWPCLPAAPNIAFARSASPEPARPVMPSTSPWRSVKLTAVQAPGNGEFFRPPSAACPLRRQLRVRRGGSLQRGGRPSPPRPPAGVVARPGRQSPPAPSRITVRSSQTSKISFR